jgi:hypothetical protein
MYLDPADMLVAYPGGRKKHDAAAEWKFVSDNDAPVVGGGEEYYLINSLWLTSWANFAAPPVDVTAGAPAPAPPAAFYDPIDNNPLIDVNNEYALRRNAKFKKEYRAISKAVWDFLFSLYGGGPVLLFYVPSGFSPEAYKTGAWMKSTNITSIVKVLYPRRREDLCVSLTADLPPRTSAGGLVAGDNAAIAANLLAEAQTKAKIAEFAALQKEADNATAEVTLEMFAKPEEKPASKAEQEGYYARKLQSAWRRNRARARNAEQRRRRAELEDACARLLQSRWRIRQARARVHGLKDQRHGEQVRQQEAAEKLQAKAALIVQRMILQANAKYVALSLVTYLLYLLLFLSLNRIYLCYVVCKRLPVWSKHNSTVGLIYYIK